MPPVNSRRDSTTGPLIRKTTPRSSVESWTRYLKKGYRRKGEGLCGADTYPRPLSLQLPLKQSGRTLAAASAEGFADTSCPGRSRRDSRRHIKALRASPLQSYAPVESCRSRGPLPALHTDIYRPPYISSPFCRCGGRHRLL